MLDRARIAVDDRLTDGAVECPGWRRTLQHAGLGGSYLVRETLVGAVFAMTIVPRSSVVALPM